MRSLAKPVVWGVGGGLFGALCTAAALVVVLPRIASSKAPSGMHMFHSNAAVLILDPHVCHSTARLVAALGTASRATGLRPTVVLLNVEPKDSAGTVAAFHVPKRMSVKLMSPRALAQVLPVNGLATPMLVVRRRNHAELVIARAYVERGLLELSQLLGTVERT